LWAVRSTEGSNPSPSAERLKAAPTCPQDRLRISRTARRFYRLSEDTSADFVSGMRAAMLVVGALALATSLLTLVEQPRAERPGLRP
jgi:hypothetical protein